MDTVGNKCTQGVLNRSGYVAQSELLFQFVLLDLFGKPTSGFPFLELLGPLKPALRGVTPLSGNSCFLL